ncbi:MAG: ASKHA domain-containing protein, partial [Desulfopila sp.]|nr:ASKHA domain-containing protein [Desulfopila sp.]
MTDNMAKIIFQPSGCRGEVPKGITIIEASRKLGVDIETLCGGKGVCGKCVVRIEDGIFEKYGIKSSTSHVSPWQEEEGRFIGDEKRKKGFRLGCLGRIQGDLLIFVPEESRAGKQVVSKEARKIHIDHNPAVNIYHVRVEAPSFEDPTGDFERICKGLEDNYGLKDLRIDINALRQLPGALRKGDWEVTISVWMGQEVIRVRPGLCVTSYGLAIDIGTTTVAGYLCDLSTMEVIDTVLLMNPQCKYGEDVMSRITYHMTNAGGLEQMSDDIIEGLNWMIDQAVKNTHSPTGKVRSENGKEGSGPPLAEAGKTHLCLSNEDIEDVTIGCNTAMHHILLKIDPQYVGVAPFPPAIHRSVDLKGRDLGLRINPGANIFILPIEAGFIGADNVGVMIAEAPYDSEDIQLIIDIGTNGELILGNKKKFISSSCATGPALEGAQLSCGMRAAPGAIERIRIDPETKDVDYKVIGRDSWRKYSKPQDMKVKGVCGSGILDVLAELYCAGIILKSGAFNQKSLKNHPRFRNNPETNILEFVLAWAEETSIEKDITITQKDVRQIQLAKGALYAGCKLMLKRIGAKKVDRLKIAGAFGTHVDRQKALIMGMFPDCDIDIVTSVGNAAGDGYRAALLNVEKRKEANWVARNVEYIELTVEPDFQREFMEAMHLPHMKDEFPHLEGIVPDNVLK